MPAAAERGVATRWPRWWLLGSAPAQRLSLSDGEGRHLTAYSTPCAPAARPIARNAKNCRAGRCRCALPEGSSLEGGML